MTKNQAEVAYGWPVVSDANDIVLVTYRLDWNTLWTWSPWPTTNEQMRQNLTNNPGEQAVFALNLQTGNEAFKINLTSGGFGDGDYLPMGNIPIVKRESNGNEVAYAIIRGDNRPGVDGRGDSKFGEVILNNNTVTGYQPGYVRFIAYNNYGWPDGAGLSYMPSDEMPFLSMAGNYLFGGHWMAGKGLIIENRDSTKGSFSNPITSRPIPHIVNSTNSNTTQNCAFSKTHYCSASVLYQEGDTRSFAGPGFYIYYGNYSPAVYDRYWVDYAGWVISDNMVLFRSTDGAIIALENGNPLTQNFVASTNGQVAGAETVKQSNEKTPGPNIIPVDSASAFIGQYKTVEGTVVDVFDNKKAIYITFSKPHTGKLLVRIKGRPYQSLKNDIFEKIKPNEVIRVTGRIDMYRGDPVIYVENLNQIKKPPQEKDNLIKNFSLKWSTKIFNKN
jgi:DNA/RNA endonuclease YhcR with UshA esterase domain